MQTYAFVCVELMSCRLHVAKAAPKSCTKTLPQMNHAGNHVLLASVCVRQANSAPFRWQGTSYRDLSLWVACMKTMFLRLHAVKTDFKACTPSIVSERNRFAKAIQLEYTRTWFVWVYAWRQSLQRVSCSIQAVNAAHKFCQNLPKLLPILHTRHCRCSFGKAMSELYLVACYSSCRHEDLTAQTM